MARSGLLDSPLISAKRVVGLPPAPLKRGNRKATRNLGPPGPPRRGDTLLTVGRDLRQHPGRPASGRLSPVIARYEAIRGGARRAGESEDPGRPSPEGATDNKQAV